MVHTARKEDYHIKFLRMFCTHDLDCIPIHRQLFSTSKIHLSFRYYNYHIYSLRIWESMNYNSRIGSNITFAQLFSIEKLYY